MKATENGGNEVLKSIDTSDNFWGITTFFDPIGHSNKYQNYSKFRESSKRQGLNLLTVELAFDDRPFELKKNQDADILIQIRGSEDNILWQKERLLNIGLENLPKSCDKIAWLDCDIIFRNDSWVKETSDLLLQYNIVQPFEWVIRLAEGNNMVDPDMAPPGVHENEKDISMAYNFSNKKTKSGQTGYAWAARRSVFDSVGFFDKNILSGGDSVMSNVFLGNLYNEHGMSKKYNEKTFLSIKTWAEKILNRINSKIFYTSGGILHLWHGQVDDRKYSSKFLLYKNGNFDPDIDIEIDENDLFSWTGNNKKLQKVAHLLFYSRREERHVLSWFFALLSRLFISFLYFDFIFLFSDRQIDFYRNKLPQWFKKKRETFFKALIYILFALLNIVVLNLVVYQHLRPEYFLVSLFPCILILIILEAYFRIQHNIDNRAYNIKKEISNLLKKDGSEFNKLRSDLALISSRNLNGFSKLHNEIISSALRRNLETNYEKKINVVKFNNMVFQHHRSGWMYALNSLAELHNNAGVPLHGFLDKKFIWGNSPGEALNKPEPILEPWIGFFHSALFYPAYNGLRNPEYMFKTEQWLRSEKSCKGIFCLSEYQREWLNKITPVPVEVIIHPTEFPDIYFDFASFLENFDKKIIQIGNTLRKTTSIYRIKPRIKRAILKSYPNSVLKKEEEFLGLKLDYSEVEDINYISDDDYDFLLSKNIVFLDLWDVAACNSIIECIVRNTPVLINKLPAAIEYLGEDYPFYFEDLAEAEKKADDLELIRQTHEYLKNLPIKEKMTGEYFMKSFAESEIYKGLVLDKKL